jgi:hypothetical protein
MPKIRGKKKPSEAGQKRGEGDAALQAEFCEDLAAQLKFPNFGKF